MINNIIDKAKELMARRPKITYEMGSDDLTGDEQSLDCSAFVWRCIGQRKYDGKRWRNTTWIWSDIDTNNTHFKKVSLETYMPGDVIVYGWSKGKPGHVAIIDSIDSEGNIMGYDCSFSKKGITYRNLNFFKKKDYRVGRFSRS